MSAPGRAGVPVARARATRDGYQTRPDSRSSVAHAARVQLSQRSWIRLSTRLHSRAVWIQAARQPSVQERILLPFPQTRERTCAHVHVRCPGRCLCAALSAQLGEPQSVLFPLS